MVLVVIQRGEIPSEKWDGLLGIRLSLSLEGSHDSAFFIMQGCSDVWLDALEVRHVGWCMQGSTRC